MLLTDICWYLLETDDNLGTVEVPLPGTSDDTVIVPVALPVRDIKEALHHSSDKMASKSKEDSAEEETSKDEITTPMVFSCSKCRVIVADSFSLMYVLDAIDQPNDDS